MIDIVLYYAFYASAVLFYGIGLERTAVLSVAFDKSVFRPALRCGVSALAATFVTELIAVHILFPLGLTELYPLAALLVFAAVLSGTGLFVRTPSLMQTGECFIPHRTPFAFRKCRPLRCRPYCRKLHALLCCRAAFSHLASLPHRYCAGKKRRFKPARTRYDRLGDPRHRLRGVERFVAYRLPLKAQPERKRGFRCESRTPTEIVQRSFSPEA